MNLLTVLNVVVILFLEVCGIQGRSRDSLGQITSQKAGKEDWETEPHFGRKY